MSRDPTSPPERPVPSTGSVTSAAFAAPLQIVGSRMNEQVVMIPSSGTRSELQTTIFKPDGNGPFPVVLMNHGKDGGDPHLQKRDRFLHFSREFVKRGSVLLRRDTAKAA